MLFRWPWSQHRFFSAKPASGDRPYASVADSSQGLAWWCWMQAFIACGLSNPICSDIHNPLQAVKTYLETHLFLKWSDLALENQNFSSILFFLFCFVLFYFLPLFQLFSLSFSVQPAIFNHIWIPQSFFFMTEFVCGMGISSPWTGSCMCDCLMSIIYVCTVWGTMH